MTAESLQKQIDKQKITDRAMELFESQSPHQLAVTLAHFEAKHTEALSALDRMTDQRDQLAAQLKDATAPEGWQRVPIEPFAWCYEWASCITTDGPQGFKVVMRREAPPQRAIDEGQARSIVPLYTTAQAVPEGWQLGPEEPTPEMLKEGTWWLRNLSGLAKAYSAMLAAAPKPGGQ